MGRGDPLVGLLHRSVRLGQPWNRAQVSDRFVVLEMLISVCVVLQIFSKVCINWRKQNLPFTAVNDKKTGKR